MTDTEVERNATAIIEKIERRGGNFDLKPRVNGDEIVVDYTTDCDRLGYAKNAEGGFMIGWSRADHELVVEEIKRQLKDRKGS